MNGTNQNLCSLPTIIIVIYEDKTWVCTTKGRQYAGIKILVRKFKQQRLLEKKCTEIKRIISK
jgi:hypothetical protein